MHPAIHEILEWWAAHEDPDRINSFVELIVNDDAALLNLLSSFSYEYLSDVGQRRMQRLGRKCFVGPLSKYVSVQRIVSRLTEFDDRHLSFEQRRLIYAWLWQIQEASNVQRVVDESDGQSEPE
jgi:hypothetical protein